MRWKGYGNPMSIYYLVKKYAIETGLIGLLLVVAWVVRYVAAIHTGIEVDEPVYRFAAAHAAQYGYPALRAAWHQHMIPFLYHPPFYLLLLAQWFRLWHSTTILTGRLLNVCSSILMLALLYVGIRSKIGRVEAILAVVLIGSDAWIIFTNQGINFENTQLIVIVCAVWTYWWATEANSITGKHLIGRYFLAGILTGCVLIYKQTGAFIVLGIFANWCFQRKHHGGHVLLLSTAFVVLLGYLLGMHLSFGSLFDNAYVVQIERTYGTRPSPGLNYGLSTALRAIIDHYFIFVTTIVVLISGSILAVIRGVQHLLRRRQGNTIILSWALSGVAFALSISLKNPHYMLLWLAPLYLLVIQESSQWLRRQPISFRQETWILVGIVLLINLWSFQARFLHIPGDTLVEADAYINTTLPPDTVVATEDYIGADIHPNYVNINFVQTPQDVWQSQASYLALYWSTTEPIPASLGDIASYCMPMATFSGFKDHVQVCRVNQLLLEQQYTSLHIRGKKV